MRVCPKAWSAAGAGWARVKGCGSRKCWRKKRSRRMSGRGRPAFSAVMGRGGFAGPGAGSHGGLHFSADLAVLAVEEQQRVAFAHDDFFHLRDENRVVAGVLCRVQAAFEISQRAAQYGCAAFGAPKIFAR